MRIFTALMPLIFLSSWSAADPRWLETTYDTFLTSELKSTVSNYRDYPLFWWNFIVIEPSSNSQAVAATICEAIGESRAVAKLPCHFNLKSIKELAESWIADTPLRRNFPGAAFELQWQSAMAKAALPLPRELLEWLRRDPMNELEDLRLRLESRTTASFTRKGGLLLEESTGRVLIPVQLAFSPTESERTAAFVKILESLCQKTACPGLHMFGPHVGNMENEMQIRADLNAVSIAGIVALIGLFAFIIYRRRERLLLLFPIMGLGVAAAAVLTVLVFGKIHAITLSFGPALVGLALDYGIHAAFLNPAAKATWRSNFMALITSLVIMTLLGFSSVPLLRQMMFFAVAGLIFSYALFYWAMTKYPRQFSVPSFSLTPKASTPLAILSSVLAAAVALLFWQPLRLDLKQMNFQTAKSAELTSWFTEKNGLDSPYTMIENEADPVESSHVAKAWAKAQGIRYEGLANDLPPPSEQKKHQATWKTFCEGDYFRRHSDAERFFPPFINLVCGDRPAVPPYLADFHSGGKWLGVFFAADDAQGEIIKQKFPSAASPREMIVAFPRVFADELRWMLPIALLGSLIFLTLYYRNFLLAALAALPFACGVGTFALVTIAFGLPINFISLMGLLMVFGFSVDYGIFAVDYMKSPGPERAGVWSALTFCAVTTVAGFAPLALAAHPVLNSLGHALLWGSIGTYIGSFWGVPAGFKLIAGRDA